MRAATYLRVSRSDQRSAMQDDETRELVKRRGWDLVRTYSDEGLSGANGQRPALRELLATLETLGELGVAFVSVHEPFDTTTAAGKLLFQLVGAFAEFERNVLRERTRSGLEAAKRRGRTLGRPRRAVDADIVRTLRERGMSWPTIARELGVSKATLHRIVSKSPGSGAPS